MAWGSTHKIKLHDIHLKQKHAIRLVCNEKNLSTLSHSYDPYWLLTVFQLTFQKIFVFMHRVKTCSDVPFIFAINLPIFPTDQGRMQGAPTAANAVPQKGSH